MEQGTLNPAIEQLKQKLLDTIQQLSAEHEIQCILRSADAPGVKQTLDEIRYSAKALGCDEMEIHEARMRGRWSVLDQVTNRRKSKRQKLEEAIARVPAGSTISVEEARRMGILDTLVGARETGGE